MANVNRGKQFEQQIREGFEKIPHTSVYRLQDSMGGYAGVANICDFIVYHKPFQYFIECKCHYGNTIPIYSNDPKKKYGVVSNTQWEGMLEQSKILGVHCGVIFWFIDHDYTCFIPIQILEQYRNDDNKSVNFNKLDTIHHIPIKGNKKRVLFDYDFTDFLTEYVD